MHPEHLVSGFGATGLHPLNRDAITNDKLQTAVPFQAEQQPPQPLEVTPITKKVTRIFPDHFQAKLETKQKTSKERMKPSYYGQSLTSDHALKMLQQREENRKAKREKKEQAKTMKSKGKRARRMQNDYHEQENVCQGCAGHFDHDNIEDQQC